MAVAACAAAVPTSAQAHPSAPSPPTRAISLKPISVSLSRFNPGGGSDTPEPAQLKPRNCERSHAGVSEMTAYAVPVPLDWLAPTELRIGLGCMRLSTDADRDPDVPATIAAARRRRDHGVRHRARLRPRRRRARPQRAAARRGAPSAAPRTRARIVTKGGMTREGGGVGARRPRQGDPRRLRGEPRRPRRTGHRHLPAARARPAHAVADLGARAGPAARRRPRRPGGAVQRQPPPARRGARARADQRRAGRAQRRSTTAPLRGGLVERCAELGITLIAHSPLGGPRRAAALDAGAALARGRGAPRRRRRPRWRWRGCSPSPPPSSPSPAPGAPRRRAAPRARRRSSLTEADRAALRRRPAPRPARPPARREATRTS